MEKENNIFRCLPVNLKKKERTFLDAKDVLTGVEKIL